MSCPKSHNELRQDPLEPPSCSVGLSHSVLCSFRLTKTWAIFTRNIMLVSEREQEGKKRKKEEREGRRKERRERGRITGREGGRKGGRQHLPGRRVGVFWLHTAHSSLSSLEQYMRYIYFLQTLAETWLAGWWHWSGSSSQPQCFQIIRCRLGPMMAFQSRQEACF